MRRRAKHERAKHERELSMRGTAKHDKRAKNEINQVQVL